MYEEEIPFREIVT